jgi:hypothetical protein
MGATVSDIVTAAAFAGHESISLEEKEKAKVTKAA